MMVSALGLHLAIQGMGSAKQQWRQLLVPLFTPVHVHLSLCLFSFLIDPIDASLPLLSTCPTFLLSLKLCLSIRGWRDLPPLLPLIPLYPSGPSAMTNSCGRDSLPCRRLNAFSDFPQLSSYLSHCTLSCERYTRKVCGLRPEAYSSPHSLREVKRLL